MLALINRSFAYVRENILWVAVAVALVVHIVRQNKHYFASLTEGITSWFSTTFRGQPSTTTMSYQEPTENDRPPSTRSTDMQRVRELQQQKATEMALVAAKEKKKKAEEERKRRNEIARRKEEGTGHRLGTKHDSNRSTTTTTTTTTSSSYRSGGGGYNPMQPWTANSGSGGYRPQRRTVNRG